jgi:hypothetical protein
MVPPPSGLPELNGNVLADVLTEDIELNGDALLEEILDDGEDEELPDLPREPYIPPRTSMEPNLPPEPSQDGKPQDPTEEGRRFQNDIPVLEREQNELLHDEVWLTKDEPKCCWGVPKSVSLGRHQM